ncbi:hypothetical protein D3C72_867700 [compost metagenome]
MRTTRLLAIALLGTLVGVAMAPGAPAQVPPQGQTGAACQLATPAEGSFKASGATGAYAGVDLPKSLQGLADSEVRVDAGIMRIYITGTDWPCFQKFYPKATEIFKSHMQT